jgi:uncharacterized protein YdhG (YjbR/CyaY superfamily)
MKPEPKRKLKARSRIGAKAKSGMKTRSCRGTKSKTRAGAGAGNKPKAKPTTIDEYFALLSDDQRAALQELRKSIQAVAPAAVECISYQLPAFRLDGKLLVAFGAWANHCAFYPGAVMEDLGVELKGYDTSKGTIRFLSSNPLPATLVRKIVKARIAKNAFRQRYAHRSN